MIVARVENLTEKRIKAGLSKSDLARKIETNHSVICRAEKGGNVSPKTARAICEILETGFDDLFIINVGKEET